MSYIGSDRAECSSFQLLREKLGIKKTKSMTKPAEQFPKFPPIKLITCAWKNPKSKRKGTTQKFPLPSTKKIRKKLVKL